jgi:hypothetical protein
VLICIRRVDKTVRTIFNVLKIVKDKVTGAVWRPHLLVLTASLMLILRDSRKKENPRIHQTDETSTS